MTMIQWQHIKNDPSLEEGEEGSYTIECPDCEGGRALEDERCETCGSQQSLELLQCNECGLWACERHGTAFDCTECAKYGDTDLWPLETVRVRVSAEVLLALKQHYQKTDGPRLLSDIITWRYSDILHGGE